MANSATAKSTPGTGSVTDERLLAAQLFNETWRLLEQEHRTIEDDDRMIHAAHASRCHWGQVPGVTPSHLARGESQVSQVYAMLGRAEPALHHARSGDHSRTAALLVAGRRRATRGRRAGRNARRGC